MPQRSRTHQLEDKSINEFKRLLPDQWVCREKGRDYGVDLEVEIFDETGQATGYFFNVQLKATDNAERFNKVAIKTDRLNYLASLEVPAIIARYCEPTNGWKWIWNQAALAQVRPDTQTVNVTFENDWTKETTSEIADHIAVLRRMKNSGPNQSIFIEIENQTKSFHYFSLCERALRDYANAIPFMEIGKGTDKELNLSVKLSNNLIKIELVHVGYLDIYIERYSQEDLAAVFSYAIPAVLLKMGLSSHAKYAARFCLEENISTPNKGLALEVCRALLSDPLNAANLAVLNNLHLEEDGFYGIFVMSLLESNRNYTLFSAALEKFNQAAANAAIEQGRNPSTIFYSLGNSQASLGLYTDAIRSFNRARKLEPSYLYRSYFLSELGGSLFLARKYKCSVAAYEAAHSLEKTEKGLFCLADSQLYAGYFEKAAAAFGEVEKTSDESLSAEIRLKAHLVKWFINGEVEAKPYEAEKLHTIMIQAIEHGDLFDSHFALLALALLRRQNSELWAAFFQICFLISEHRMLLDAMITAHAACGAEAYSICRQRLLDANEITEGSTQMEELDHLFEQARGIDQSRGPLPVTLRLIGENGPEAIYMRK